MFGVISSRNNNLSRHSRMPVGRRKSGNVVFMNSSGNHDNDATGIHVSSAVRMHRCAIMRGYDSCQHSISIGTAPVLTHSEWFIKFDLIDH